MLKPENKFPPSYDLLMPDDMESLQTEIEKRFTESQLGQLLFYKAGWKWDDQIAGGSLGDRVFRLVEYLHRVGQLHWLVDIIDCARKNNSTFEELRARLCPPLPARGQAVAQADPRALGGASVGGGGTDPWGMVLLDTCRPFLGRTDLRSEYQQVWSAGDKPILAVAGDPDTGKSYSARYLAGVAEVLRTDDNAFVTKEIRLDRLNGVDPTGATAVSGPGLAERLAWDICDVKLEDHFVRVVDSEQDSRWAADVAHWIVSRAGKKPLRWIVLDGFGTTVLSPGAQELIKSLIDEVARSARIRIALLGYPGDLSWCNPRPHREVLDLTEFTGDQLTEHVIGYLLVVRDTAERRQRPPYTYAQLYADVRSVLGGVVPTALDLHALEASLTAVTERVLVGV